VLTASPGCIECGRCARACPVTTLRGFEDFPGPRTLAVDAPRFGKELSSLRSDLEKCTTCWRCEDVCPSRIPLVDLILDARRELYSLEGLPSGHRRILENIDAYQRAVTPAKERGPVVKASAAKLLYFPGCIAEERLPAIRSSTTAMLSSSGHEFRFAEGWSCCGAPLEKIGDQRRLQKVKEENLKAFDGYETLVTSCPGCLTQFVRSYKIDALHTLEFLKESVSPVKLQFRSSKTRLRVALQQPCHLARTIGPHAIDYSYQLLQRVPGLKLVEIDEPSRCCGGGGGVVAGHPDIALSLAQAKVRSALDAKADIIVAPCPFCVTNLGRAGGLPVQDLVEFLASHMSDRK